MKHWEVIDSVLAFDNRWFKLRRDTVKLPDGRLIDDFFMWEAGDVAHVVALTPDQEIVMVRQYKHAAGKVVLEIPAGYLDDGEDPLVAARREFEEETGYVGGEFVLLSKLINNPTKATGHGYIYFVSGVHKEKETQFDAQEEIETVLVPVSEVLSKIDSGEIWAAPSVAGLLMALRKIGLLAERTSS